MFLSSVFAETLSNAANTTIELYDTDGAEGAARGAAFGEGIYRSFDEAFRTLKKVKEICPDKHKSEQTQQAYYHWKNKLKTQSPSPSPP
jgi:xylulokinase